ncbi:serine hydrolase [bacterium]|nr:serine hydrolase [bacterium]
MYFDGMEPMFWIGFSLLVLALFLLLSYFIGRAVFIVNGYKAMMICSGVFLTKQNPDKVEESNAIQYNFVHSEVDPQNQAVTTDTFGFLPRKAVYYQGLGSILVDDADESQYAQWANCIPSPKPEQPDTLPWPTGDVLRHGNHEFDRERVENVVNQAFKEEDEKRPKHTRAVLVVHNGDLILERYAPQFDKDTQFNGWSLTKSVINALYGVLAKEGKIDPLDPAPVPEWKEKGDPRQSITLNHLLRMTSGLDFDKDMSHPFCDSAVMCFGYADSAEYAIQKPWKHQPGTVWEYNNGNTCILSHLIRLLFENDECAYISFPRAELFNPLGMRNAVLEMDRSGTFYGSAFMYATARDWARLGLLYLWDGIWEGNRILPEGWVRYSTSPTLVAENGKYGAHFWTNEGLGRKKNKRFYPRITQDAYFMMGFAGQSVTIIPSKQLVIVRLGHTFKPEWWDFESFIQNIEDAFPTTK